MNLFLILAALNISIIFSETPAIDCGFAESNTGACYQTSTNTIILGYSNLEYLFPHEIAHASGIDMDLEVRELLADYPDLREYDLKVYDTEEKRTREKVADWFAYYYQSKSWNDPESFDPEVKELFDRKLELIK